MRIDEGSLGELRMSGTPEEWAQFAVGLEDLYLYRRRQVTEPPRRPQVQE